ncbi:MAG: 23S rRNA (uracil(1939)-C(5))-methyltransferase RlmD [Candidatus Eremiobacteraeota bacterium]|nr:23S rRNA (uracil(1939)-C(5))-methyltransferase RlmD [Candidatus Eremiobacteraeota bacterium]
MTNSETAASPPALRVGAEVELTFGDLLANGQAVGRLDGMVVFVFGPLPGERARVRITARKAKYAVGEVRELLATSPHRVEPFCRVFGSCGGCQVQHLSYDGQLAWKRGVVASALQRIGGFAEVKVRKPVGMIHPRNYRNKMSLVVDRTATPPLLGFYKQRSHDVVPIDACPIVQPALDAAIEALNGIRKSRELVRFFEGARHVVARTALATDQTVVTVTTTHASAAARRLASTVMQQIPTAVGVSNSYDMSGENAILGRKQAVMAGRGTIEEQLGEVRYAISSASFFQVNTEIVERILAFLKHGLQHPLQIVDLYSGAGTFALFFAKHGASVVGIEENRAAVAEARENAELNSLTGSVRFQAGRVEEVLGRPDGQAALAGAQVVFLDPPRKGSDERTLGAVAAARVPHIWYLSCDPATLARDLKFLAANGYRLGVVQPFDMFPQTGHVETLVTLYREAAADDGEPAAAEEDPFRNAPVPQWPDDEFAKSDPEYPEFVIR